MLKTTAVQNQMAREEVNTTYVQMNILKQRVTQLKQSIDIGSLFHFKRLLGGV